jgi:hypothetical protein
VDPSNKPFQAALTRYRDVGTQAAQLHKQVGEQERKVRKLLALDAMELVASSATNPLTAKPHSWTSAVEAVKDSEHADQLSELLLELRYTTELAEIEAKMGWAEVLFLVRSETNGN